MGLMRSGKDTSADYIINKVGGRVVKFADPIYEIQSAVYKIMGMPEVVKNRFLLQWVGTEFGRQTIDPNVWVNITVNRINQIDASENIFVTDCRFANEERALRDLGFEFLMVRSDQSVLQDRGASLTTHESERFASEYEGSDYTILNNGTLEDLYGELDKLIQLSSTSSSVSPASQSLKVANPRIGQPHNHQIGSHANSQTHQWRGE